MVILCKRKADIAKQPELERSLMRCVHELGAKVPGVRGWRIIFEWAACDYTF